MEYDTTCQEIPVWDCTSHSTAVWRCVQTMEQKTLHHGNNITHTNKQPDSRRRCPSSNCARATVFGYTTCQHQEVIFHMWHYAHWTLLRASGFHRQHVHISKLRLSTEPLRVFFGTRCTENKQRFLIKQKILKTNQTLSARHLVCIHTVEDTVKGRLFQVIFNST